MSQKDFLLIQQYTNEMLTARNGRESEKSAQKLLQVSEKIKKDALAARRASSAQRRTK